MNGNRQQRYPPAEWAREAELRTMASLKRRQDAAERERNRLLPRGVSLAVLLLVAFALACAVIVMLAVAGVLMPV